MISPWQIAIIIIVALLLFGSGGRISSMMGDFAKGIKSFRKGLKDDDDDKSLEERSDKAMDVTPVKDGEKTSSSAD